MIKATNISVTTKENSKNMHPNSPYYFNPNIRTGRHCVFDLHIHLVFVTKYRKNIFTQEYLEYLRTILEKIVNDFESILVEFNGEKDHIHLLIHYPTKISIAKLVNSLKGVSSRRLKQEFPAITKYYWKGKLWSPSYFAASCGGAPLSIIKEYIQKQDNPK